MVAVLVVPFEVTETLWPAMLLPIRSRTTRTDRLPAVSSGAGSGMPDICVASGMATCARTAAVPRRRGDHDDERAGAGYDLSDVPHCLQKRASRSLWVPQPGQIPVRVECSGAGAGVVTCAAISRSICSR